MFGLSFPELVVVLIVALVVLGPERLPKLAKTIGKTMRDVRRTTSEFKDMVEGEFSAIEREVEGKPERKGGVPDGVAALPAAPGAGAISHAVPALRPAGAVPATVAAVHRADEMTPADGSSLAEAPASDAGVTATAAVDLARTHVGSVADRADVPMDALAGSRDPAPPADRHVVASAGATATDPAARAEPSGDVADMAIAGTEGMAASPKDA